MIRASELRSQGEDVRGKYHSLLIASPWPLKNSARDEHTPACALDCVERSPRYASASYCLPLHAFGTFAVLSVSRHAAAMSDSHEHQKLHPRSA